LAGFFSKQTVASVTVLFHPDHKALETIRTYSSQVGKCFVVDNSPASLSEGERSWFPDGKFEYHHLGRNRGVAAALNFGVRLAAEQGFSHVLTMDQDTRASEGLVGLLQQIFTDPQPFNFPQPSRVAVACPALAADTSQSRGKQSTHEAAFCITSGNLIDVSAWAHVAGFDEDLFIDHVDHDYCLRVRAAGYSIVQREDAILDHHTGSLREIRLFGLKRTISMHSPDRLFYMTRNGLLLKARYGKRFPEVLTLIRKRIFAQVAKSLVFGPERLRRMNFMLRGYADYKMCVAQSRDQGRDISS
jgi:rhamnosyltransferase